MQIRDVPGGGLISASSRYVLDPALWRSVAPAFAPKPTFTIALNL
jgi:hypothetical protein